MSNKKAKKSEKPKKENTENTVEHKAYDIINIITNIIIIICLAMFLIKGFIESNEILLIMRIISIIILISLISHCLKYKNLVDTSSNKDHGHKIQLTAMIVMLLSLQIWKLLIDGRYNAINNNNTFPYILTVILLIIVTLNLFISIGIYKSKDGNFISGLWQGILEFLGIGILGDIDNIDNSPLFKELNYGFDDIIKSIGN